MPANAPTAQQRAQLRDLRALLRRIITDIAEGRSPATADLRLLDAVMARATYSRRLRRHGSHVAADLAPKQRTWAWVLAEIATALVQLLAEGEPARVKLCANDLCGWTFYDHSKNRRRRWCGAPSCGDADKVRRYRARQRAAAAEQ